MLRQLLVGAAVSACNIAIHALVMTAVVRVAHGAGRKDTSRRSLRLIAVMMATVSVLMAAHVCRGHCLVAGLRDRRRRTRRHGSHLFRLCNYTTLGYGDVTPVERWQLLGTDDGDERRTAVWLVDRRHFRSAAENGETRGRGNVQYERTVGG